MQERSNANFQERHFRETSCNQKQSYGQSDYAKMLERWIENLERMNVGIGNGRDAEEQNEPRPVDARLALSVITVPTDSGTSYRTRANLTMVPTASATAPYFSVAPTTELVS